MPTIFSPLRLSVPLAAVAAAGALAACQPYMSSEPTPVAAENPSVTYQYDSEQELLAASERARAFCSQYESTPYAETASLSADVDDGSTVVFECVRTLPSTQSAMAPTSPTTSGLTYTYRTDQELLVAAQSAESYCERSGLGTRTIQDIVTNADGSKTVVFHCVPR